MKWLHYIGFTLVVVGAFNWGFIGLFNFNLVSAIFGSSPSLVMLLYVLIGLSAVWIGFTHMKDCKICSKK